MPGTSKRAVRSGRPRKLRPKAPQSERKSEPQRRDIIVIGASAGGVTTLRRLLSEIPPSIGAAIFVVLHTAEEGPGMLADVLARNASMPAAFARDKLKIENGHIYVAPPGFHLMLRKGLIRVTRGPRENRHRPAIDALFRSAAKAFGHRVIGVILTGFLNDGTAGLLAIQEAGGITVVQDPHDAEFSSMPANALEHVKVNYCLPLAEIPPLLVQLASGAPVPQRTTKPKIRALREVRPSIYTCPECHGTLWETEDGEILRFRCRVGHSYTAESMIEDQTYSLERTLWAAVRGLEERADIARRVAIRVRASNPLVARRFEEKAESARENARTIQALLTNGRPDAATEEESTPVVA